MTISKIKIVFSIFLIQWRKIRKMRKHVIKSKVNFIRIMFNNAGINNIKNNFIP